jgi:hypothetical protein
MFPQLAASNSGHAKDGWIHEASWRKQEIDLVTFAGPAHQDVQKYQVKMTRDENGVPADVTMRWQEVTYKIDSDGNMILEEFGMKIEESRVTRKACIRTIRSTMHQERDMRVRDLTESIGVALDRAAPAGWTRVALTVLASVLAYDFAAATTTRRGRASCLTAPRRTRSVTGGRILPRPPGSRRRSGTASG